MALYLRFLGVAVLLSGFVLGGLSMYAAQDHQRLEHRLAQVNTKYEKIGKEIDALIDKNLEKLNLLQRAAFDRTKGIILVVGGLVLGSLLIGVGEALSMLKKISRRQMH